MDLDDRKIRILNAIVKDYILTAEPVGSRTIEKKYNLGVSAATIRNEMSDLEALGFLVAPHTSAGRVPSDRGIRLYVDNIIKNSTSESSESFEHVISSNISKIETLMEETANIIASYTNYATVVSEESFFACIIKRIQLIPVDNHNIMLVMIFDKSVVKNEFLQVMNIYSIEYIDELTKAFNIYLAGKLIEEITSKIVEEIIDYVEKRYDFDNELIQLVIEKIVLQGRFKKNTKVYKSGVNNILEYPEFYNNASKVKDIFESIEQNEFMSKILLEGESDVEETKFDIVIGEENKVEQMKDLTVFKVRCKLTDDKYGNISIIGPKRMDYEQTISMLNGILNNITTVVKSIDVNDI